MNNKREGFTLIELITVLVILAIVALIVTPLVINIIGQAKESANKRSVDAYGKAVELSIMNYLLDTGQFPTSIDQLTIEYTGKEVTCTTTQLNSDSTVYLTGCSVGKMEVKDDTTDDGYYHYGTADETTKTYKSYSVGDEVTYNGVDYYVIANSDENTSYVTLLKAEPLTVDEVNTYGGVGTDNNHVNQHPYYGNNTLGTAYNSNGYGGVQWYSSETCGYTSASSYKTPVWTECTSDYSSSDVKYIVDAWAEANANNDDLTTDETGYSARLITLDDLTTNLGYESASEGTIYPSTNGETPSFVYSSQYYYWTMNSYNYSSTYVWRVSTSTTLDSVNVFYCGGVVRPVITILKSAL